MNENNKQLNTNGNLKTVRTYLSDMADTVRQNEISVIKVALAEQNKNERENIYRQEEGTPIKKVMWFIGGAVLIIGSIVGVYFLLNQKTKNTPAQITKEETVISYDETSSINTTDQLTERINSVKKEVGANGSIKFISLSQTVSGVEEKLSVKDLFSSLKFSASPSLIRALSDSYMVGTYTTDKPHLFLLLQIKDYDYTYAGMLEWENSLANDTMALFELDTKENKIALSNRKWSDVLINNKDARVLINENGKPILYYIFNDKNNLIVTDSLDAIKEIASRLITKNIKPL